MWKLISDKINREFLSPNKPEELILHCKGANAYRIFTWQLGLKSPLQKFWQIQATLRCIMKSLRTRVLISINMVNHQTTKFSGSTVFVYPSDNQEAFSPRYWWHTLYTTLRVHLKYCACHPGVMASACRMDTLLRPTLNQKTGNTHCYNMIGAIFWVNKSIINLLTRWRRYFQH